MLAVAMQDWAARSTPPPARQSVHPAPPSRCGAVVCGHAVFSAAVAALLAELLVPPHILPAATEAIMGATHGEAEGLFVSGRGAGYLCADASAVGPEVKSASEELWRVLSVP